MWECDCLCKTNNHIARLQVQSPLQICFNNCWLSQGDRTTSVQAKVSTTQSWSVAGSQCLLYIPCEVNTTFPSLISRQELPASLALNCTLEYMKINKWSITRTNEIPSTERMMTVTPPKRQAPFANQARTGMAEARGEKQTRPKLQTSVKWINFFVCGPAW